MRLAARAFSDWSWALASTSPSVVRRKRFTSSGLFSVEMIPPARGPRALFWNMLRLLTNCGLARLVQRKSCTLAMLAGVHQLADVLARPPAPRARGDHVLRAGRTRGLAQQDRGVQPPASREVRSSAREAEEVDVPLDLFHRTVADHRHAGLAQHALLLVLGQILPARRQVGRGRSRVQRAVLEDLLHLGVVRPERLPGAHVVGHVPGLGPGRAAHQLADALGLRVRAREQKRRHRLADAVVVHPGHAVHGLLDGHRARLEDVLVQELGRLRILLGRADVLNPAADDGDDHRSVADFPEEAAETVTHQAPGSAREGSEG
jgi:hypothetical protein